MEIEHIGRGADAFKAALSHADGRDLLNRIKAMLGSSGLPIDEEIARYKGKVIIPMVSQHTHNAMGELVRALEGFKIPFEQVTLKTYDNKYRSRVQLVKPHRTGAAIVIEESVFLDMLEAIGKTGDPPVDEWQERFASKIKNGELALTLTERLAPSTTAARG